MICHGQVTSRFTQLILFLCWFHQTVCHCFFLYTRIPGLVNDLVLCHLLLFTTLLFIILSFLGRVFPKCFRHWGRQRWWTVALSRNRQQSIAVVCLMGVDPSNEPLIQLSAFVRFFVVLIATRSLCISPAAWQRSFHFTSSKIMLSTVNFESTKDSSKATLITSVCCNFGSDQRSRVNELCVTSFQLMWLRVF